MLAAIMLTGGLISVVTAQETAVEKSSVEAETADLPTVTLRIDYGNDFEKVYAAIPWREKLTIADLMQHSSQHPQPTKFQTRGSGATAFLTAIDGIENEGYGKKCWIFYLNGKKGDASYATVQLSSSDSVLWRYQKFP